MDSLTNNSVYRKLSEAMKQGYLTMSKTDKEINKEWESTYSDGLDD